LQKEFSAQNGLFAILTISVQFVNLHWNYKEHTLYGCNRALSFRHHQLHLPGAAFVRSDAESIRKFIVWQNGCFVVPFWMGGG
jgi:hypothetical protein